MTPSRYILAKTAMSFGIGRRQRRMADAASESHLLKEAEQVLGRRVWERVEGVEELGVEYWNLRRLVGEREKLRQQLDEAEEILRQAHEQRSELLNAKSDEQIEMEERRAKLIEELEESSRERDQVVDRARDLRRVYDGLKAKLEVLKSEHREDPEVLEKTKTRMNELKQQFTELKERRDAVGARIDELNTTIDELDGKLEGERKQHRSDAAGAFQNISEVNRRISSCKAEIGLLDTRIQQLYGEIGRHVSRNSQQPACREAIADARALVDVMKALRQSIGLNHRLAEGG